MDIPKLKLAHTARAVRDMDRMVAFYRDVLGFHLNDRGIVDKTELAFMSQDPAEHHQFILVSSVATPEPAALLVDHIAFRTDSLDSLRSIRKNLINNGIKKIMPVCHGNAWSLYYSDPENNGLECFVDSPFHVAQPLTSMEFNLDQSDEAIIEWTRTLCESGDDFQPMSVWRDSFVKRLKRF